MLIVFLFCRREDKWVDASEQCKQGNYSRSYPRSELHRSDSGLCSRSGEQSSARPVPKYVLTFCLSASQDWAIPVGGPYLPVDLGQVPLCPCPPTIPPILTFFPLEFSLLLLIIIYLWSNVNVGSLADSHHPFLISLHAYNVFLMEPMAW